MNAKFITTLQVLLMLGIVVAVIGLYYEVMEAIKPMKVEYELYNLPTK